MSPILPSTSEQRPKRFIDVLANVRQQHLKLRLRKRQKKTFVSVLIGPAQFTVAGQNQGRTDDDGRDVSHPYYSPPFPCLSLSRTIPTGVS
ncbi:MULTISPECIES: hypothetical protein [Ochrobactrum]|uniref:Uncharacterized protein n=1 Tax=Ochrobactrum chromiisoli TaxID=2993941 RepID=A0ABT3QPX5_9HYPH|nr:hypothetical protein [Ochrobactrum chromiisoli]MCX2697668.1 hypothetical protein [Ochrobactrum chromiisoli]